MRQDTKESIVKLSFPLVGNLSEEGLRTGRLDTGSGYKLCDKIDKPEITKGQKNITLPLSLPSREGNFLALAPWGRGLGEGYSRDNDKLTVIVSVIFALLFLALFAGFSEASIAGKISVKGLHTVSEGEFHDIFGVKEGSRIDNEIIRNGIKRAFLKGVFEDISVEVLNEENPKVLVSVKERDFIRKLYVTGKYSLSKLEIMKDFMFKEDSLMRYDLVGSAAEDLKNKLSVYGYPGASVSIETVRAKEPYSTDVHLKVDTGIPLIIKKIIIKGDDSKIKKRMKLSEGDVYNQNKLKDDLKRIKDHYKKQRHYGPQVGPFEYKDGELTITVNSGKRLKLLIKGNSRLSGSDLMKEAPFFETESFNDEVIEESVVKMLFLYHEEGYPFAQIAPVIESDEKDIEVTFYVFEGEKIKLGSVRFTGTTLPQDKLRSVLSLQEGGLFNPDSIDKDKESLEEFYGALGYLNADIKEMDVKIDKDSRTADLNIEIEEGLKTVILSYDITGVEDDTKEDLKSGLGIKKDDPYNEIDISNARFMIMEYFRNYGYPDVDVEVARSIDKQMAVIEYRVIKGRKKLTGKTIIAGNRQTKYEVVKRELPHEEDQPYNMRVISEGRQKLYKLGLFTDVETEPVDMPDGKKDILIKVNEGNAGSFEFGIGYAEYEKLRGFFEVNYINLLGMNRQAMFRTELSTLEKRYILQYKEPWFWGIELPFRIFFLKENRNVINITDKTTMYNIDRYSLTAGVEKKWTERLKTDIYYEYSLIKTTDVLPDVILSREDTGTLSISSIKPSIVFDTRDDPFNPRKGFVTGISLKVASTILASQTNFQKLEGFGSTFFKLSKRNTLALSARAGMAYGYKDTKELPISERFFLGGRSSVRGYDQDTLGPKGSDGNPTGGNAFVMGNIEMRTSIGRGFGIVPFFDMGNVWVDSKDMDLTDLKYTAGIGLRYNTPVGPIRIDYGFKLNRGVVCVEDKMPVIPHISPNQHCSKESPGALHFSIGHAF
ncbi:MAG: outer membrane protein assembly factor BamA [Nitrospirae bacterium GWC2_42_7]|nr:MAG: outer membrane protein assembly factor BamA [Nitrospirae bacterium GWC2_42_7]